MAYSSVYIQVPSAMLAWIRGLIVRCWTLSSIRITPSPPRWIIPKIGGFSVASVPRPGFPLRRLRRPRRPFFPPPRASPCGQRPERPRHMPLHRFTSERASCAPCLGVTDASSGVRHPYYDRVLGPCGGSSDCAPCKTGPVSTPEGADDDRQRSCPSHRQSVARRTSTKSADARVACRHVLASSSHNSHPLDNRHRWASVGRGRFQNI